METMESVESSLEGFRGTVQVRLPDLIQMVCLARSDLVVQVRSGGRDGSIFVKEGRIYHAETAALNGEAAFFEIFRWEDGHFETAPPREPRSPTIEKPWEHLLLEAVRRGDETSKADRLPVSMEETGPEPTLTSEDGSAWLEESIDRAMDSLDAYAAKLPEPASLEQTGPGQNQALRVLVVDDSAFFSRRLKAMLEEDPFIQVVKTAKNGREALDFLASSPSPDVITLDVHMPVMPGDTTLKHIMIRHPIPVLILSSFEGRSMESVFEFLQVGAVDISSKPREQDDPVEFGQRLRQRLRRVSRARVTHFKRWRRKPLVENHESIRDSGRILVILGAEGAHLQWLRLPLHRLCRHGIVIGLQRISRPYLEGLGRFIEEAGSVPVETLEEGLAARPGTFHLGTGNQQLDPEWNAEKRVLICRLGLEKGRAWPETVGAWLTALASQARNRLDVHVLSSAEPLDSCVVQALLDFGARFFLSPPDMVMCADMLHAIQPYGVLFPNQVLVHGPETLMEAWLGHETAFK